MGKQRWNDFAMKSYPRYGRFLRDDNPAEPLAIAHTRLQDISYLFASTSPGRAFKEPAPRVTKPFFFPAGDMKSCNDRNDVSQHLDARLTTVQCLPPNAS